MPLDTRLNTRQDVLLAQIRENLNRDTPMFLRGGLNHKPALIVGGGPSLVESVHGVRFRHTYGGKIFALNNTHDWLLSKSIRPDYHVMLDGRPENIEFVRRPHPEVKYLISAQCHPAVFDALKNYDVEMWIPWLPGVDEILQDFQHKPISVIGGGPTVGLSAMNLCYLLGHRKLHLFGFDSCYQGGMNHAYSQPLNDGERMVSVTAGSREFRCSPWMASQAEAFQALAANLVKSGCSIYTHGDGLIQHIWKEISARDKDAE